MSAPKPPDDRQRQGKRDLGALPEDVYPDPPEPPPGLLPETADRWREFWASPLAWAISAATELDQVERLFLLRDTYARYRRTTRRRPTVRGSTKQVVAHPLIRAMPPLATEIRQLEDRLGFGPTSRRNLGIHLPDAQPVHDAAPATPAEEDAHAVPRGDDYDIPDDPRLYALDGGRR